MSCFFLYVWETVRIQVLVFFCLHDGCRFIFHLIFLKSLKFQKYLAKFLRTVPIARYQLHLFENFLLWEKLGHFLKIWSILNIWTQKIWAHIFGIWLFDKYKPNFLKLNLCQKNECQIFWNLIFLEKMGLKFLKFQCSAKLSKKFMRRPKIQKY